MVVGVGTDVVVAVAIEAGEIVEVTEFVTAEDTNGVDGVEITCADFEGAAELGLSLTVAVEVVTTDVAGGDVVSLLTVARSLTFVGALSVALPAVALGGGEEAERGL